MARKDPPSLIPAKPDRAADGSVARRRHSADERMWPTREAGGTGLHASFARDPKWTDPRPRDDLFD